MKKTRELDRTYATVEPQGREGGPGSAGQSGDTQGLPSEAEAGEAGVKELLEEGQTFEAEALLGIGRADGEEAEEVRVRQSRRPLAPDDVPPEVPGQP